MIPDVRRLQATTSRCRAHEPSWSWAAVWGIYRGRVQPLSPLFFLAPTLSLWETNQVESRTPFGVAPEPRTHPLSRLTSCQSDAYCPSCAICNVWVNKASADFECFGRPGSLFERKLSLHLVSDLRVPNLYLRTLLLPWLEQSSSISTKLPLPVVIYLIHPHHHVKATSQQ